MKKAKCLHRETNVTPIGTLCSRCGDSVKTRVLTFADIQPGETIAGRVVTGYEYTDKPNQVRVDFKDGPSVTYTLRGTR